MTTFLIILIVSIIILAGIIIYNLLWQISQLESEVKKSNAVIDRTSTFYNFLLKIYVNAALELKRIDRLGAFASDDEVGFIFNTINETIAQINNQMKILGDPSLVDTTEEGTSPNTVDKL